jgi:Spy/CpxP family protein refolding chaperone
MRKYSVITAAAVVMLSSAIVGTALVRAADEPATPSTHPSDAGGKSGGRVSFKPYSGLTSLTSEQVEKINGIHKKFLDEERELQKKHEADCMAVLTDAQKDELKQLHEKELADGKAKRADQRQKAKDGGK